MHSVMRIKFKILNQCEKKKEKPDKVIFLGAFAFFQY